MTASERAALLLVALPRAPNIASKALLNEAIGDLLAEMREPELPLPLPEEIMAILHPDGWPPRHKAPRHASTDPGPSDEALVEQIEAGQLRGYLQGA